MDEIRGEVPHSPDLEKPMWLPMRSKEQKNGRQTHGAISWTPNLIPYANILEIDTEGFNRLLTISGISHPIEIVSFHPKDENKPDIASVPGRGVATASATAKRVNKPRLATMSLDPDSNKVSMYINFSGIADYLDVTLPNGHNNPEYNKKYGEMVNKAIRNQMPILIAERTLNRLVENFDMAAVETLMILPLVPAIIDVVSSLAQNKPIDQKVITFMAQYLNLQYYSWASEAALSILGKVAKSIQHKDNSFSKYADEMLKRLKEDKGLSTLVPWNFKDIGELIPPIVNNISWKRSLVRGATN